MEKTKPQFPIAENITLFIHRVCASLPWRNIVLLFVAVEIFSFLGHEFRFIEVFSFAIIVLATILFSMRSLHYGILIALAELIIGSQGHLFAITINDFIVPLRLGIFSAIVFAYGITILRERQIQFFQWYLFRPFLFFIIILLSGTIIGLLYHNGISRLFFDVNGYLYLGLIGPATQIQWTTKQKDQLLGIFVSATIVMSLMSLFFLTFFAQTPLIPYAARGMYVWIRDVRLGEVTRFDNGFVRVFLQSQIYALFLFFMSATAFLFLSPLNGWKQLFRQRALLILYICFALSGMVIFLSYSRSFWAGSLFTLIILICITSRKTHGGFLMIRSFLLLCIVTAILDFGIIAALVNIPFPGHTQIFGLLSERTKNLDTESAAATRYQSLQPLITKIKQHPILGSGFGSTVTYYSRDPRILQEKSDGRMTTSAVEWGYLDMLMEFGIVGVIGLGWIFMRLANIAWRYWSFPNGNSVLCIGLFASLVGLFIIHALTPYLNHPLGLGWLIIVSIFLLPTFRKQSV